MRIHYEEDRANPRAAAEPCARGRSLREYGDDDRRGRDADAYTPVVSMPPLRKQRTSLRKHIARVIIFVAVANLAYTLVTRAADFPAVVRSALRYAAVAWLTASVLAERPSACGYPCTQPHSASCLTCLLACQMGSPTFDWNQRAHRDSYHGQGKQHRPVCARWTLRACSWWCLMLSLLLCASECP